MIVGNYQTFSYGIFDGLLRRNMLGIVWGYEYQEILIQLNLICPNRSYFTISIITKAAPSPLFSQHPNAGRLLLMFTLASYFLHF